MEEVADAAWNASVLGVRRVPGVDVVTVMPWIVIAAAALPKTPPCPPVAHCSRSSVSWWAQKVVFHAVHVLLARGRLSQSGRCFGKLPAAKTEPVAIAASHLSSIRSFARTDFFCAFSRRLMYSGMCGSSAHQTSVAERSETMSVALRPPLPPLRRAKKSRRGTLL